MIENNLNEGPPGLIEPEEQAVVSSAVKGASGRSGRSNRNREKTHIAASIDGVSVDDALKNVCYTT